MILRRDHIAGGAFIAAGVLVFALSGDLPFGTLASPGAGMVPKLVLTLLIGLGATLVLRAGESPPLAEIEWSDVAHAATVVAVSAAAIALYTVIGFVLSISLLM
ncbi:MAG: tripartite tricarboxylate transporter TctB family protein, partial [Xanthobacteraceae bacterium]